MTVERRHEEEYNRTTVVDTACQACDEPLPDGIGFAEHWRKECTKNPANK